MRQANWIDRLADRRQKKGLYFFQCFLWILSCFYGIAVTLRNWAYDKALFRSYRSPLPVISVGNLVAGGTGKTPLVELLAQELGKEGPIALLSRGYRSPAERSPHPLQVSQGMGPLCSALDCGDEPYLLAKNCPSALVFAGRSRISSAKLAQDAKAHLLILDDGMQHRQLARDWDIVTLDARNPFGEGWFLPYGLLREGLRSLRRAHLVILNGVENEKEFEEKKALIARFSKAPVVGMQRRVKGIFSQHGEEKLSGKKVGLFCGIANPFSFVESLRTVGAEIVEMHFLPDHRPMDSDVMIRYAFSCKQKGADHLVCTQKDWVKLESLSPLSLPLVWVKSQLEILFGQGHWIQFLELVKQKMKKVV